MFVYSKSSRSVKYQADSLFHLVTDHNVEHVAGAFHRVIVGAEFSA